MTTLLIAEHDNKSLKDATAKALTKIAIKELVFIVSRYRVTSDDDEEGEE